MTPSLVKDDRFPYLESTNSSLKLHYDGSNSPQQLPLVLAGPILRRVSADSITVWVAFREKPTEIELEIYDGINGSKITPSLSTDNEPVKVGENLFICAVSNELNLDRQKLYSYDLRMKFPDVEETRLDGSGVLRANQSGYSPINLEGNNDERPSFVYPPKDPDDLRLFYGSCRKPHGRGKGTMRAVADALTDDDYDLKQWQSRPHLLLLGGDQIYGDDVADQFFAMLWNYGDVLLGAEEEIYDPGDPEDDDSSASNAGLKEFRPDHRQNPTMKRAKMSAAGGYGTSHLFGFGEYMTMYLCIWSDVFWPPASELSNALPSKFDLWHLKENGTEKPNLPPRRSGNPKEKYEDAAPDEQKFKDIFSKEHKKHEANTDRLKSFRKDLPAIRRALANVPTYMIWDDHDVTDDWFVNGRWVADVLGNEMGNQIVGNGMAAAIACQHWGNQPKEFSSGTLGKPGDFLEHLKNLPAKSESPPGEGESERNTWFYDKLGIPTKQEAANEQVLIPEHKDAWNRTVDNYRKRFNYHFGLTFGNYGIAVLDTRTWRGFPDLDPEGAAEIISMNGQAVQLEDIRSDIDDQLSRNPGMTIESFDRSWPLVVQNPVPLWPVQEVNIGQEFKYEKERMAERVPAVEGNDGIAASEAADYEHWRMRRGAMENLVSTLASMSEYVVTLSGDVHHGFTNRAEYWHHYDRGPAQQLSARFANLTSSAAKNEDGKTRFIHGPGYILDSAVGTGGWYYFDAPTSLKLAEDVGNTSLPYEIWDKANQLTERYFIGSKSSWTDALPTTLENAMSGLIVDEGSTTLSKGDDPHYMTTSYLIKGRGIDTEGLAHAVMLKFAKNHEELEEQKKKKSKSDYILRIPIVVPNGKLTQGPLLRKYEKGLVDVEFRHGDLILEPREWLLPDEWKSTYNLPLSDWWTQHLRPTWNKAAKETSSWVVPNKWAIDPNASWEPTIDNFAKGLAATLEWVEPAADLIRELQSGSTPHWEYRVDYLEGEETAPRRTKKRDDFDKNTRTFSSWKKYKNENFGKEIVGRSNFGEVRFDWSGSGKRVKHWLWWRMNGTGEVLPWTEWSVDMTAGREQPSKLVEQAIDPW